MRRFLNTCTIIEETVAAIYRQLAKSVACDAELKSIWLKMASEEDQHTIQVNFAARLPERETFKGIRLSLVKAEKLLRHAEAVLKKALTSEVRLEDALQASITLEGEFLAVHAASAAEFVDGKMREMFQCLAQDDREHLQALEDYSARHFGNKPKSVLQNKAV